MRKMSLHHRLCSARRPYLERTWEYQYLGVTLHTGLSPHAGAPLRESYRMALSPALMDGESALISHTKR